MPTIAILFYGRINKCRENYENIKKYLIDNNLKNNKIDIYLSCDNGSTYDLIDFIRLYNPINYCNESKIYDLSLYNKYSSKNRAVVVTNMIPHFINLQKVFKLLELSNIKYDLIVSTRLDIIYSEEVNLNKFIYNNSCIIIPNTQDHGGGINDQIAIGYFHIMKIYMNIYENLIDHLKNGVIKHPENLIMAQIIFNNIKIHRFNLSYEITR